MIHQHHQLLLAIINIILLYYFGLSICLLLHSCTGPKLENLLPFVALLEKLIKI